ncbi:MAG: GNAT family N-acetyltransferase [Candidatus Berkiella sp.]
MQKIELISPHQAEKICRELTADLPEWFGIPIANEQYAKGCLERTSIAIKEEQDFIGMITLEYPFNNNANIYWMAVKRAFHGKQVGTQLLQAAVKDCRQKGFQTITVETLSPKHQDPNYLKTYLFYEKCGFKPLFELKPFGPELLMCYMIINIQLAFQNSIL